MEQVFRPLVVTSTAAAVLLGFAGPVGASADFDPIGHRGYTARRTENTLPALRAAVRRGASAVEVDVRLSRDGRMVLMHDRSVGRTTNGTGYVDRLSSSRIKALRTPDGARVPFVKNAVRSLRRLDASPVLEIKAGSRWTGRRILRLQRVLRHQEVHSRALVISFDEDLLRRAERVAPGLTTSWVLRGWPSIRKIRRLRVDNVSVSASVVGPERVRRLRESGIGAVGRSADRTRAWERFARAGVLGVVTNRVPAYVRWDRSG